MCDKETETVSLDYMMNLFQKYCDKTAGLKVQNKLLEKENNKLHQENLELSAQLKLLTRDYEIIKKEFQILKDKHTEYVNQTQLEDKGNEE